MAIVTDDKIELLKYLFALGALVTQMYIICWLGDKIIASVI